ncbi:hypothetical protein ACVWXN_006806 [Bradyrhizobium sp. i1.4.4]
MVSIDRGMTVELPGGLQVRRRDSSGNAGLAAASNDRASRSTKEMQPAAEP